MKCNYCGREVGDSDRPATKAWCGDGCYQRDKAKELRKEDQSGLFEVLEGDE